MPVKLIDHNYKPWLSKKRQENGAATYSYELCQDQIHTLILTLGKQHPDKRILISSAPPLDQVLPEDRFDPDLLIQYLHTYPYKDPFGPLDKILTSYMATPMILVTAYKNYYHRINLWIEKYELPVRVIFLPMSISIHPLAQIKDRTEDPDPADKRIIYFGNLYRAKATEFYRVVDLIKSQGWTVDVISKSKFNNSGEILNREQIWEIIRGYSYGIGVGRCAQEMYALGLKVLISGEHWGGLLMDPEDLQTQLRSNFNGRIITGTRDLIEALELLPYSYSPQFDFIKEKHYHWNLMRAAAKELLTPQSPQ
jgi:hypothetical protein